MANVTNVIEDRIQVIDKASGPLKNMQAAGQRLAGTLKKVMGMAARIGGFAGAFGIGKAVYETDQLYESIERLQAITGETAENTHAMLDAMALSGVQMRGAEQIMVMMQRTTDTLAGRFGEVPKMAQESAKYFKQMGIDIAAGPNKMLLQMADAAQRGQLETSDLINRFQIPIRQAGRLQVMLKKGRAEIQRMMDVQKSDGDIINDAAMKNFLLMQRARREMGDAWGTLVGILYKAIIPGLTKVFRGISDRMNSWAPAAQRFGETLGKHMGSILTMAGTLTKIMIVNKALMMTTGIFMKEGVGLAGAARGIMGVGRGGAAAAAGAGGATTAGAKIVTAFGGVIKGMGRMLGLGAIVIVIVAAFTSMLKHSESVRKAVGGLISNVFRLLKRIGAMFAADSPLGKGLAWFVEAVVSVLNYIVTGFQRILDMVDWLTDANEKRAKAAVERGKVLGPEREKALYEMRDLLKTEITKGSTAQAKKLVKTIADLEAKGYKLRTKTVEALKRRFGLGPPTPGGRPAAANNFDFRGSRFDIRQEFAEGFDPSRVATVMANDLAALGERRLQSGLAPLFTVR